jgi:DNA transformation protein
MFGGLGLYADEVFFGVVDNDTVFFRTGDSNRGDYEALGMKPFQPMGPDTKPMAYHAVPADVLEQTERLAQWLDKAITAARAPKAGRRKSG